MSKYHVISVFAYFDAAFALFEETAFGDPDGDGAQGLFRSQGILHLEAFSVHGGVEGLDWTDVLDGEVSAVDYPAVLLEQALVGVGVLDALGSKALASPIHVGSAVRGLDGGDDGILAVSIEIVFRNEL